MDFLFLFSYFKRGSTDNPFVADANQPLLCFGVTVVFSFESNTIFSKNSIALVQSYTGYQPKKRSIASTKQSFCPQETVSVTPF
jgi:hypothetical protein